MSIASTSSRSPWYATNGATRTWNYAFKIPALANVVVDVRNDATGIITEYAANISGTGFGLDAGGVITYPILPTAALAAGFSVRVRRVTAKAQALVLKNQAAWNPSDIETALDLAAMRDQEQADAITQLQADLAPALNAAVSAAADAATATAAAGTATTQAGIATTQAGIATTQAGAATTQAGNAAASAVTAANNAASALSGLKALRYFFSTTTADADPGNGFLRLGNATQSSSVVIRMDLLDRFGVDVSGILDTLDASTNVSEKATIRITAENDPNRWLEFRLASRAAPSGYRNMTVTNIGPAGSPLVNGEPIAVTYTRTGDKGLDGAGTGDVVGPAGVTAGHLAIFSGATGKLIASGGAPGALANKNTVAAADIDANAVTTVKIPDANVTYAKLTNIATAAEYRSAAASRILDAANAWSAAGEVLLTDGATVTPDFSAGINFLWNIAGNRTLANPTGLKNGQAGVIRIIQDATGGRTIAFGAHWKFAGGSAPTLSTGANAQDYLYYYALNSYVHASLVKQVQ